MASEAPRAPSTPKSDPPVRYLYVWLSRILIVLLIVGGILALLPRLCNVSPLRQRLLNHLTRDVVGELSADELWISWFRPWRVQGLRLRAPDGTLVLHVPTCQGDRSLWQWLFSGGDLGTCRLERPQLELVWDSRGGNNLEHALRRRYPPGSSPKRPDWEERLLKTARGTIEVHGGRLRFQSGPGRPFWTVGDLNMALAIESVPELDGGRAIVARPGKWIDHLQITPGITEDLLQYVAPILSQATQVDGCFSLESAGAVFPLDDLAQGFCRGTLTIHRVRLSAGPLIEILASQLIGKSSVVIIDECAVPFTLRDRTVSHEGLRFQLSKLALESSGTVGLDQQIRLAISLQIPERESAWGGPLMTRLSESLSGRQLSLPFHGTLKEPRLDWEQLTRQALAEGSVLRELLGDSPETLEGLRQALQELRARRSSDNGKEPNTEDRPLRRLRNWFRGQRDAERPAVPPRPGPPNSERGTDAPQ